MAAGFERASALHVANATVHDACATRPPVSCNAVMAIREQSSLLALGLLLHEDPGCGSASFSTRHMATGAFRP